MENNKQRVSIFKNILAVSLSMLKTEKGIADKKFNEISDIISNVALKLLESFHKKNNHQLYSIYDEETYAYETVCKYHFLYLNRHARRMDYQDGARID